MSWNASVGATHYKVYYDDFWSTGCSLWFGRPRFCEELAGNVVGTRYTHTSPDANANYYWVTACNSAGCSDIDSNHPAQPSASDSSVCANSVAVPDPEDPALVRECDLLLGVKARLTGRFNTTRLNWSRDLAIFSWDGVTIGSGRVTHLFLTGNQLTGTIPHELSGLTNLQYLNLSNNQLRGTIPPELGGLTNLQTLSLSHNQLRGTIPPELGGLTNLLALSLGSNLLTGTIPPGLGGLTNLLALSLSHNQLRGTIPPELGGLTNLLALFLTGNQLTGTIPPELGGLTNLQRLSLLGNQLTGTIPPELGGLTNLQTLFLGSNQLTGTIPPELGGLTNLQTLSLGSNQLTGTIPAALSNLVPPRGSLEEVIIASGNKGLCGPIPAALLTLSDPASNDLHTDNYPAGNLGSCAGTPMPTTETPLPPPPVSLGFDPFYQKYLDASGVPVIAPSRVADEELSKARDIMLAMISTRPDLFVAMVNNGFYAVIYDPDVDWSKGVTLVPELKDSPWLRSAAGVAVIRWRTIDGTIAWAITVQPDTPGERIAPGDDCNDVLIHEFAHMVHFALVPMLGNEAFEARLKATYNAAMSAGLWREAYASVNYAEYWAEVVRLWFRPVTATRHTPWQQFAKLADYDPQAARLVAEVFGAEPPTLPSYCAFQGFDRATIGPDGQPVLVGDPWWVTNY